MTDYRWQVELWDPATALWTPDGNQSLATGIARRFDGTAEDLAERLLRNWTGEPSTVGGRWRATIWDYDPAGPAIDAPAATKEITRLAGPEADPCTVTEYFVTSIGPTLHYTLTSTAGHVLDYSREPDGNVGAQIKVGNRWIDLAKQGPGYQAVIQRVREYEASNPDLAGYNNPQAASAGPGPVKTADRYVVARINKTYRTLGERPGPQHVGKTFVAYDDRHLSKQAAEESAEASNGRYRPSLHGKTYIAVRAEPVPGTNKFRNLDHPSLTSKVHAAGPKVSKTAARAAGIQKAARAIRADGRTARPSPDFPDTAAPIASARPARPRRARGQASPPAVRRTP